MSFVRSRRLVAPLAPLVVAAALVGGSGALAGPAGASPAGSPSPSASAAAVGAPTLTGVATAPTGTSPDVTITYTITVTGDALADAILVAFQPRGQLDADPTSVLVDGLAPLPGAAFSTGDHLTVGVGVGAGPASGGLLAPGTHTVSFRADASTATNGAVDSAALSWTNPTNEVVTSGSVPVPLPDISVTTPPGSGEDGTLPLGTGSDGVFAVLVRNTGAAVRAATLTITLPPGLTVDEDLGVTRGEDGDDELTCSDAAARTVTCALGAVTRLPQLILIPVQATPDATVGTVGRFTVAALADSGVDGNRADNAVTGSVEYAGLAHISLTLSPASRHVPVGGSTDVHVTVRNDGPQAAAGTIAVLGVTDRAGDLSSKVFRVTHFTGRQIDLGDIGDLGGLDGSGASGGSGPVPPGSALRLAYSRGSVVTTTARTARAAAATLPVVGWDVRTLAAGRSASATLTLKAVHVGTAVVTGLAIAGNSAPDCATGAAPGCSPIDEVTLAAVAAHVASGSSSTPVGTGGVADTGAPVGGLTLLGLLALLAGAVLLQLGVVRHRGRHRAG